MKASACKVSGDMQCAASRQRDTDIPFPVACCWGRLQRKGSWQKHTTRQGSASDPSHTRHGFAVLACVTKEQPEMTRRPPEVTEVCRPRATRHGLMIFGLPKYLVKLMAEFGTGQEHCAREEGRRSTLHSQEKPACFRLCYTIWCGHHNMWHAGHSSGRKSRTKHATRGQ